MASTKTFVEWRTKSSQPLTPEQSAQLRLFKLKMIDDMTKDLQGNQIAFEARDRYAQTKAYIALKANMSEAGAAGAPREQQRPQQEDYNMEQAQQDAKRYGNPLSQQPDQSQQLE